MKIISIELKNIGLYKDQVIDLYSPFKAVHLFWGNNGAGKTTLLNAIKTGLLGSKSFGMDYDEYCTFIKDKLISARSDENYKKASIKISLEMKEQNELVEYAIERTFVVSEGVVEETIDTYRFDEKMDFISKEQFLNKVEINLPPSLMDVIIFDRENAINILNKDEMHKLIKNVIHAVFGMDLYLNLIKDLNSYLKNMTVTEDDASDERIRLISLESKYKETALQLGRINSSLDEYKKRKTSLLSSLNVYLKKLTNKTGVVFDEMVAFKDELSSLQANKKQLDDEIKYMNEEILPLKILHKRIKKLLQDLSAERPYIVLNDLLSLKSYFAEDEGALSYLSALESKIKLGGGVNLKYNLSESQVKAIENVDKLLDSFPAEKLNSYYSSKNSAFSLLKSKLDSIEKLNDDESQSILSEIESISSQLSELQTNIDASASEAKVKTEELGLFKAEYDALKKKMVSMKKESNSYINISLYKNALEEFVELNVKDICEKLSVVVHKELMRIRFRNGSIGKVYISPKTYEMHLYEKNGKVIPSKLFSAGEKQILLGLALKESISLSKIDTFFLFDTPVGRLDMGNRKIFTEEVIFKVSEQSVIFATDSDYTESDYKLIKNSLSREYRLSRDGNDQIVVNSGGIY